MFGLYPETPRRCFAKPKKHHVLCVEHLLGELRHGERAVLLRATRRERREASRSGEQREPSQIELEFIGTGRMRLLSFSLARTCIRKVCPQQACAASVTGHEEVKTREPTRREEHAVSSEGRPSQEIHTSDTIPIRHERT